MNKREDIRTRAFGLDSRTVWVEQQIYHGMILPKDNFHLGPNEYKPRFQPSIDRHVSTPKLGTRRLIDQFTPFQSGISIRQSASYDGPFSKSTTSHPIETDKWDQRTIWHDYDKRQPLDPNKKFCKTPGSQLPLDSGLGPNPYCDGVQRPSSVLFSKFEDDRNPVRLALPSYNIKYDSEVIRRRTRLGKISKSLRFVNHDDKLELTDVKENNGDEKPWKNTTFIPKRTNKFKPPR